ncbi:unnamed protein product [Gemmata massiliana]|uniref:Uncharacterized protein n=1 Tax=Gemmata massiliana TaxID=1210884 RepID=A0A6P2DHH2_9BACT|nr:hypothetical protein [Gemmata massiliana]VTS01402.1 unnamed protein product [Gemmata massiliana]
MRSIATIFAVAALVVLARGDDKKADPVDGKKLLGKWELKERGTRLRS